MKNQMLLDLVKKKFLVLLKHTVKAPMYYGEVHSLRSKKKFEILFK